MYKKPQDKQISTEKLPQALLLLRGKGCDNKLGMRASRCKMRMNLKMKPEAPTGLAADAANTLRIPQGDMLTVLCP